MFSQNSLITDFKRICDDIGFRCLEKSPGVYIAHFSGDYGNWIVFTRITNTVICVSSLLPFIIPPWRRTVMMEAVTRINYGLTIGNFELDLVTGEMRCRTSINVASSILTTDMFSSLLSTNLRICDHWLPTFRKTLGCGVFSYVHLNYRDNNEHTEAAYEEASQVNSLANLLAEVDIGQLYDPGNK